jgi:HEAT repeat protein
MVSILSVAAVFHCVPRLHAADSIAEDERLLKQARIGCDGPALLAFFEARSLDESKQKQVELYVQQLGNESFGVREQASRHLSEYGPPARRFLQKALESLDPEVARRARFCLDEIDRGASAGLAAAAVRLLTVRKPAGSIQTLLTFLPFNDDDLVEEEALKALAVLGFADAVKGQKRDKADPVLAGAVNDPVAARRSAAAFVLAGHGNADERAAVRKLLADPDAKVRFRAAQGLVAARDKVAVPVLITLLADAPLPVSWQAEELLYRLGTEQSPAVSIGTGDAESRRKCQAAWTAWWRDHGPAVDLSRVEDQEQELGLTVIAELDSNKVWECGRDGQARWQLDNLRGPIDAQILPGGRVLIAENAGKRVTERDLRGTVLWEKSMTQNPIACQRLRNGNTFITTYQGVMEVDRDGKELYNYAPGPGGLIFGAHRQRNGLIALITSQNMIIELDSKGRELKRVPVTTNGNWCSVERLSNGHYLVAATWQNKVMELDGQGKSVWDCSVQGACSASRLSNGHILVACMSGKRVVEVDRSQKTVWEKATEGRPFHAHRR